MQHWRKSTPTREQGNAAPGAFQPRYRSAGYGAAQTSPRSDHSQPAAARTAHAAEDLRLLARSGKDAAQNGRLSMAALVPEGVGRAVAG